MRTSQGTTTARCGAYALAAALLLSGLAPPPAAHAQAAATQSAPAGLVLDGLVDHALQLTAADLRAMPATTLTVSFNTEHGTTTAAWTGVPLWTLIARAGISAAATANRSQLQHVIMATGRDGYAVAFSLGELDPRFGASQAMVVYARDGQPLADNGLRLIVPGDKLGGRGVQTLIHLDIR